MQKLILSFFLVLSSILYSQVKKDVLFLGNSYTYVNDLPKLIQDIAISMGDSMSYDQNTPGGYTLEGHTTNTTSLNKIQLKSWDVVVLQEQSQRPSFSPSQVANDVFPYAKQLVDKIKTNDSCTNTIFYMTWGRKYGDQQNCQFYSPVCTYLGMQKRLRESYVQMALDNDASVAPVGMAWKESIRIDSNLNLYSSDNSHPSIYGSYLSACVFYSSIFHKSSVGSFHPSNVASSTALILQNISDQTVFDSLQTWRIDTSTIVKANFTYQVNYSSVQFQNNSSSNATDFYWEFGDGNVSIDSNPTHNYLQEGKYNVRLTSSVDCMENTFVDSILVISTQTDAYHDKQQIKIFPNPAKGVVNVQIGGNQSHHLTLRDVHGRTVINEYSDTYSTQLNTESLVRGIYYIQIRSDSGMFIQKVILH